MNRSSLIRRAFALLLAALLMVPFGVAPAMAQDQGAAPPGAPPPVMQTVFYNVVYGSALGALIGLASSIESSSDKTQPQNTHQNTFEGATIGGLIGLGVGLYLVYAGIIFDPASVFVRNDPSPGGTPVVYEPKDLATPPGQAGVMFVPPPAPVLAPFALETARGEPGHITGFRARVMDFHF